MSFVDRAKFVLTTYILSKDFHFLQEMVNFNEIGAGLNYFLTWIKDSKFSTETKRRCISDTIGQNQNLSDKEVIKAFKKAQVEFPEVGYERK